MLHFKKKITNVTVKWCVIFTSLRKCYSSKDEMLPNVTVIQWNTAIITALIATVTAHYAGKIKNYVTVTGRMFHYIKRKMVIFAALTVVTALTGQIITTVTVTSFYLAQVKYRIFHCKKWNYCCYWHWWKRNYYTLYWPKWKGFTVATGPVIMSEKV